MTEYFSRNLTRTEAPPSILQFQCPSWVDVISFCDRSGHRCRVADNGGRSLVRGLSESPLPIEPVSVTVLPSPQLFAVAQSSAVVRDASIVSPLESVPSYELNRIFEEVGVNEPDSEEPFEFFPGDSVK